MSQVTKINVWVPDQNALKQILAAARVQTECGSPKRDSDGTFIVTLYGPAAEAEKIVALGYRYERDDNFGETLEQAQAQVSKTDRFQGGSIKPQGLGVKR